MFIEREEDIAPKVHIKYTFAYVVIPNIDSHFNQRPWCPRHFCKKESRTFTSYDGKPTLMHSVLSEPDYKGSLREAYDNYKND